MSRYVEQNRPVAQALREAADGDASIRNLARNTGVAASRWYDYAENRANLPAYLLPVIYAATKDIALFAKLAGITDAGLVLSKPPESASADSVMAAGLRVGSSAGRVQLAVVDAIADGKITGDERRGVEARIEELEREAAQLRQTLRAMEGAR